VKGNKRKTVISLILLCCLLAAVIMTFVISPSLKMRKHPDQPVQEASEPVFRKDGTLKFIKDNRTLTTISIEISDDDTERRQGLMYRNGMPDTCGMLFIFDEMQPLSFWMKNTFFSLDIIFLDDNYRIVSIAKNTVPFSEASISSGKDAMYVVEVNAGFCGSYGISEGVKINFNLK
jgi:uncharacterized protein